MTETRFPGRPGVGCCRSGSSRPSMRGSAHHRGNHEDSADDRASAIPIAEEPFVHRARKLHRPCTAAARSTHRRGRRQPLRDDP